jgi:uncharacterized protein YqhQ
VDDTTVLAALTRADAAADLPRLGGMARPDGVAIVSERAFAFADVRGGLRLRNVPAGPAMLRRVPFVRGLVKLGSAMAPLFARGGSAGPRERLLLVALVLAPVGIHFLPDSLSTAALVATTLCLLAFMFRGRTLYLHGAEHRAIAAAESRSLVATWNGAARPSRFASRCGTNFAALLLPVTLGLERVWIAPTAPATPFLVSLLSLTLTMELWLVIQARGTRLARALLAPGLALQRLTTREPSLPETRVALRAVAAILEHDRAAAP